MIKKGRTLLPEPQTPINVWWATYFYTERMFPNTPFRKVFSFGFCASFCDCDFEFKMFYLVTGDTFTKSNSYSTLVNIEDLFIIMSSRNLKIKGSEANVSIVETRLISTAFRKGVLDEEYKKKYNV